jgi:hypothetical protein
MKWLVVLLSAAWLGQACPAKEAPWVTVSPATAGFTVKMPAPPKLSRSNSKTPLGEVTTQLYTCSRPWGSYTLTYTDLPGMAVTFALDRVFEDARSEVLKDAQARQLSYTDSTQFEGKDLSYVNERIQGWTGFYLMGDRLYVADVRVKKGSPKQKYVDPFFASLRLQEDPEN